MKVLLFLGINLYLLLGMAGIGYKPYPPLLDRNGFALPPSREQQLWALATCAILTESNGQSNDLLGGCERSPVEIKIRQESLAEWWDIHSRKDLLDTLVWIEEGGHRREFDRIAGDLSVASPAQLAGIREKYANNTAVSNKIEIVVKYKDEFGNKSIVAWDFSRYVSLCGWGYIVGYLTEDEAWERIMPVARLLQKTFTSWEDLGKNHVVGREFWSLRQTQQNGARTRRCYDKLRTDPSSPWRQIEWKMKL